MQNLQKGLFILISFLISSPCFSQKIDFDRVITPSEMRTRNFKEYLIQLAWNNSPENEVLSFEKGLREFEVKAEKKDWMDDVKFSINLNENNLNPDTIYVVPGNNLSSVNQTNLFPIFNFNATVSLGTLSNRKNKIGMAKQRVKIAESNINQKKLNVRMEILKRYETFLMFEETLKAVIQAEENANQALILVTNLFKADKATFKDYNVASISYNSAVEKRIKANAELKISQYLIEEMIGISFEKAKIMRNNIQ